MPGRSGLNDCRNAEAFLKAVILRQAGGPEELQLSDIPKPRLPSPSHILVRLRAAGVNPVDYKLRKSGTFFPDRLPAILGCDGAGIVEECGKDARRFRPGDRVFFMHGGYGDAPGTYAQWTTVPEYAAAVLPDGVSFEEASALPIPFITAWEALSRAGQLEASAPVLIHAGAGGVGHLALQLARNRGLLPLTTVRGEEKAREARTNGAIHTIDPGKTDFVQATLDFTGGKGVQLVVDTVGGETFCRSFDATALYGHVSTLLEKACDEATVVRAKRRNLSLHFVLVLSPSLLNLAGEVARQTRILESGARMLASGAITVRISRSLPLDRVREAHDLIETGHTSGKIVLTIP